MTTPQPRHSAAWPAAIAGIVLTAAVGAYPSDTRADAPAYAGMWSKTSVHCSTEQKRPGAPMLITPEGFDQYKLHCKFTAITPSASQPDGAQRWQISADCTWNGIATKLEMAFAVAGDVLTLEDSGGKHILRKCVPPQPGAAPQSTQ